MGEGRSGNSFIRGRLHILPYSNSPQVHSGSGWGGGLQVTSSQYHLFLFFKFGWRAAFPRWEYAGCQYYVQTKPIAAIRYFVP